jgi:tRNA(Glu) U13 pseudouridine synthase TruD
MRTAEGEAATLETRILESLELDATALDKLGAYGPGTRRDLLVDLKDLTIELGPDDSLSLSFGLPSGSYATQVVREFTRADFLASQTAPEES